MAIKNILIHLSPDGRSPARQDLAVGFAREHEARLTALYTMPVPRIPGYSQSIIPDHVLAEQRRLAGEAAEAAKAAFVAATERDGVRSEWRLVEGAPGAELALHARYCDVAIVGQEQPEAGSDFFSLTEALAFGSGRPVITVPYAGAFKTIGERVLVAWDATREATRALHDAMPILAGASEVVVYRVNPPERGHIPGADIAAHLAQHGVKAEAHQTVSRIPADETAVIGRRSIGVGDLLLSAASDFGADLLVMGAYGHSRIRELVLGGTTRYILQHMTIPVLMSH
jgi:nucleotide-binding universal stress UspA family protein